MIFGAIFLFCGCNAEKPVEEILESHPDGSKKQTLWIYSDGTVKKKNEWYGNGIKKSEVPYKNNVPHGKYTEWTSLGDVITIGNYVNGKRDGIWKEQYKDKSTRTVFQYKDGTRIGDWLGYYQDGSNMSEQHYGEQGDSIGIWKKWHKNGNLAEEQNCFQSVENGFIKKYRIDGTLEFSGTCKHGALAGKQLYYFSDGKKVQHEEFTSKGQADSIYLDGPRTFFYGNGTIQKKEFWKKGQRINTWSWYDQNQNLLKETLIDGDHRVDFGLCNQKQSDSSYAYVVCAESTFTIAAEISLDGKLWYYKQGHMLRYEETWEKGNIKESHCFYVDSLDSKNEGGKLACEGSWANGKKEGIWRNWHKNGIIKDSLSYVNDERIGEQFSFDSTGKMVLHKTENGKNGPIIMHLN